MRGVRRWRSPLLEMARRHLRDITYCRTLNHWSHAGCDWTWPTMLVRSPPMLKNWAQSTALSAFTLRSGLNLNRTGDGCRYRQEPHHDQQRRDQTALEIAAPPWRNLPQLTAWALLGHRPQPAASPSSRRPRSLNLSRRDVSGSQFPPELRG
jgi:hypothetical protein